MQRFFVIILVFATVCCTKKPQLGSFDTAAWRADKGGCKGVRQGQVTQVKALKKELLGVSANDIGNLLGKPDIQRLEERNQEYYVYFTEPGPHCGQLKPVSNATSVMFRFNAMNLATEITIQNGSL
jgi:hypothetical protein